MIYDNNQQPGHKCNPCNQNAMTCLGCQYYNGYPDTVPQNIPNPDIQKKLYPHYDYCVDHKGHVFIKNCPTCPYIEQCPQILGKPYFMRKV